MEAKPQIDDPPPRDRLGGGESPAVAGQDGLAADIMNAKGEDKLSEKKRKRDTIESSRDSVVRERSGGRAPATMILPNGLINAKQLNNQNNIGTNPGVPRLSQQLRAPMAAQPAIPSTVGGARGGGGGPNESFGRSPTTFQAPPVQQQQQQQQQQPQQGFNIFGLNAVQIQQLLMLQMQQMQGLVGSRVMPLSDPNSQSSGPFNQAGSMLLSPQQQMGNHAALFLGGGATGNQSAGNRGGLSGVNSLLQPIQPAPGIGNANALAGTPIAPQSSAPGPKQQVAGSVPAASATSSAAVASNATPNDDPRLSGRQAIALYMTCDDEALSEYQCLVRKNIELFEATHVDVESNAQGRNKPIVLGQVGIRCRHCTMLPPKNRSRGAMYYPGQLDGLYQAAQNQAKGHLTKHCHHIPPLIRNELLRLNDHKSSAGGGKKYWADGVRVLGVVEDAHGLRFEKRP